MDSRTVTLSEIEDNLCKLNNIKANDPDKAIIHLLVDGADKLIKLYLKWPDTLPSELSVIVQNLAQTHYVKHGKEGTASFSESGYSLTWKDDELKPYKALLNNYLDDTDTFLVEGQAQSW
ncbi:phage head-tail connector protein [Lactiplantibacillus plantarum]|uniref:phage head-tail connector protein n=1 Tax=Lactiplantibacillus plantarum TaxID=1590 RepID=UPI0030956BB8